jgi:hypothetical protein
MFAFMVNQSRPLNTPDGHPMYRGFFVWNSEVGAASFGVSTFRYRRVCGNHIVWDAKDLAEVRLIHLGSAREKAFRSLRVELRRYADGAANEDEARIAKAATFEIAKTKDEVLDAIWRRRITGVTRGNLVDAYETTERNYPTDGNPRTAWGMAQGLTRVSQTTRFGEDRVALDRAAGKIMSITF